MFTAALNYFQPSPLLHSVSIDKKLITLFLDYKGLE